MNAHYNNYVCDDCGDTFLARTRLKQHVQIHNTGKFSCSFCEKVFTLQKYRRKHEETVHEQRTKFKCQYCPEKFAGEYLRHLHCLAAHPETVKTITCEFCGDCFTWKQYYTSHIRKKHQNRKPYECDKCSKKFFGNYELKEHMLRHVGVKNFECPICHKRYVSMNSLKQHAKQHKIKEIVLDNKEERLIEVFVEEYKPESGADTADNTISIKDEMEYEEIEFLVDEDAAGVNDAVGTDSSQQTDQSKQVQSRRKQPRRPDPDKKTPKRKWPKKLPKSERWKTYRQYSEDDLRKCLEEVRNHVLTASEASAKYNVPKKTICGKIRAKQNGDEEVDANREKMFQLIKEIKTILTFTNATPYKSKSVRYYCAYCSTDGPHFDEPDDLRTHTRTEHNSHRTEKIEYAMRPYWMNEVIKLDIDNLICTVCCVVINNWNDMFKHLKDKHNVVLEQAYTRVIPYVLKSNLQCALCKEPFSNYLHLDGHMNAHYNNYVCGDCGDTFLAQTRLKQHALKHNTGKFSCSFCKKVFTLQKYRRKHEEMVHEQRAKFKCQYCPEKFAGECLRHTHCLAAHPETVKTITCEFCGDCFTWKQYYTSHIRKKHRNMKPYECDKCTKKFPGKSKLQEHMLRHVGVKNFECPICHKKYMSLNYLKQHVKLHKKKDEA